MATISEQKDKRTEQTNTQPSNVALQKAAQLWCLPNTEKIEMNPTLAYEIAKLLDVYIDALIWCSGSADFAPDGQARKGWEKICKPLI